MQWFNKTHTLRFRSRINAPVDDLYHFHTDTRNLPLITPPWIKVKILDLDLPLHQGSHITLSITRFFISQTWKMMIKEMKQPHLVCDTAIISPFTSFTHYHFFNQVDDKSSELVDEIHFKLPFYPLSLLFLGFIKHDMKKMFTYRHLRTQELILKHMFTFQSSHTSPKEKQDG
jgi:ligand-binding SRPBCC domain-containing protein